MYTFTDAEDIEWAYEQFENKEDALNAGKEYFGEKTNILLGKIEFDNKVTPVK